MGPIADPHDVSVGIVGIGVRPVIIRGVQCQFANPGGFKAVFSNGDGLELVIPGQNAIADRAEPSEAVIGVAGGHTIVDKLGDPLFQVVGVGAGVGLAVDDFHQVRHIVVVVVLPAAFVAVTVRILPDDPGGPVGRVVVVPLGADPGAFRGGGCVLLDPHQRTLAVVEVPQLRAGSAAGSSGPQQGICRFSAGGFLLLVSDNVI